MRAIFGGSGAQRSNPRGGSLLSADWIDMPLTALNMSGHPAESYLGLEFCRSIRRPVAGTLEDSWAFYRDLFAVVDNDWFDLVWFKNLAIPDVGVRSGLRQTVSHAFLAATAVRRTRPRGGDAGRSPRHRAAGDGGSGAMRRFETRPTPAWLPAKGNGMTALDSTRFHGVHRHSRPSPGADCCSSVSCGSIGCNSASSSARRSTHGSSRMWSGPGLPRCRAGLACSASARTPRPC
jgi:hypothetical protein